MVTPLWNLSAAIHGYLRFYARPPARLASYATRPEVGARLAERSCAALFWNAAKFALVAPLAPIDRDPAPSDEVEPAEHRELSTGSPQRITMVSLP